MLYINRYQLIKNLGKNMLNKKIILMLTLILVSLLAVSAVSAADNATSGIVSVDETTDEVISDNGGIDNAVIVEDNSTAKVDFDLLDGEGYEIVNNTIYFNLTDLNTFYKSDDYYIFDYSDGNNTKELSSKYSNTYEYCYNLNLTNNSDYNYTFYGHRYSSGNYNAQPWSFGQYSNSNLVLQGSFKTDDYGNIVDFNHNQHLKLVLSNYNNTCTVESMSNPYMSEFNLNGEDYGLSIGKKFIIGINVIEPTYFSKKVFNVIVHGKDVEDDVPEVPNIINVTLGYDDVTIEIDVLENAIRTDKNTIHIDYSNVAKDWSYQEYIFDYNDNYAKSANNDKYSFNLALSPNTKYDYEFLGRTFVAGYDYYRPWVWDSGYQRSVMFNGTFETDDNGYICNLTHNQHYKFVFRINGQIDLYGGDVKSFDLNNKYTTQKGRLLKGSNLITLSVLSMKYNFNVFRPYTMYNGDSPIGSFSDLKDRMSTGLSEFILDCDYVYNPNTDSNFQDGIKIETYKTISIDGNGHTIDGNGQSKVFQFNSPVILKNITFTNFNLSKYNDYGVIYWSGTSGTLEDCKFINILVNNSYGAIRSSSTSLKINNCYFDYNYAKDSLFYLYSGSIIITNCTFNNNTNVLSIGSSLKTSEISNCLFINNNGITIKHSGVEGMITNCTFINNSNNEGGAISIRGKGNILFNSLFINNTASDRGGAISWSGAEGIMNNCTFINNSASNSSGAVSWTGGYGTIDNCIFINNTPSSRFSDTSRVFKRQLSLNSSNYVFNYKQMEPIFIIIHNLADNRQVEAPITFKLNNGIKTKNISSYAVNDVVCLFDEISDLDVGNWTVDVIFEGDDNYYSCNTTFIVTINPTVANLIFADKINTTYRKQTNLSVIVFDCNNLKINEGTVDFFDGENQIGEAIVSNGIATLTYVPYTVGEHVITAFYHSDNYVGNSNSSQLYVNKSNPLIKINFDDPIEGSDLIVNVDIEGATGKVIINGDEFRLVDGKASKSISNIVVGKLPIDVVYFGDDNYLNATNSTKITVKPKQNPNLDVVVNDIKVGQTATISVFINENVTGKVTVNDNEIPIISGKGNYTINGLSEGNYKYIVKFEGDKYFNESNKTVSLKVSEVVLPDQMVEIIAEDIDLYYSTTYGYIVSVVNQYGNPVVDAEELKVVYDDGQEEIGEYDDDGIFLFNQDTIGNRNATILLIDSYYRANPVTINVKISKSPVKITAKAYYSNTKQYSILKAVLKDTDGEPIDEGKVKFNINGKSYYVNVKNGVATKKIKLTKAKTYTYSATYIENGHYKKSKTSSSKIYVYSSSKKGRTFNIKGYKFTLTQNQYNKLINAKNTGKTVRYTIKTNKKVTQTISYDYKKFKTIKAIAYAYISYGGNEPRGQREYHNMYSIFIETKYTAYTTKGKLILTQKASTINGLKNAKVTDMSHFSMM